MSGFTAGIFSVAGMLVVVAIVATLVKNSQGTEGLIQNATAGFGNDLLAAQGAITSPLSYAQY